MSPMDWVIQSMAFIATALFLSTISFSRGAV
jgi:hypothetical protein